MSTDVIVHHCNPDTIRNGLLGVIPAATELMSYRKVRKGRLQKSLQYSVEHAVNAGLLGSQALITIDIESVAGFIFVDVLPCY